MDEKQKDRIEEVCDDRGWDVDFHSDGCTIRSANGASVEYHRDTESRRVDVRAKGRLWTVLRILRVIAGDEEK